MAGLAVLHHPVTRRHAVVDTERFHFSLDARVRHPIGEAGRRPPTFWAQGSSTLPQPLPSSMAKDLGVDLSPFIQADRSISGLTGSPPSPETQNQVETRLRGYLFLPIDIAGKGLQAGNR